MDRPPLDEAQLAKALEAYHSAREQAVRYVLGALDPSAFDAPALPYAEVLTRVQAILAAEAARYAAQVPASPPTEDVPAPPQAPDQGKD